MISIDQLLESVDLDFEPRWVTKDKDGTICIFGCDKPKTARNSDFWAREEPCITIHRIKLADFENKDWQECIYEVPKKVDYTKLVGKLCWFWDEGFNTKSIVGFLTNVDLESWRPFCIDNGDHWEHCEPVRPDDGVIYKGE